MQPATSRVDWQPSYRIVSSRFPPVGLFDSVAHPEDLEAVYYLEGLTNPRLRQEAGQISLVPKERRVCGPGTTPIMAAFTHVTREGSRFSDGSFGVYYAAKDRLTAIAETMHHRTRFLRNTSEPACVLEMRCYVGDLAGTLHDIRGGWPQLHDRDSYVESQAQAVALRQAGSDGVVYDSVRLAGGQCVAAFYPDLIQPVRQESHLYYHWNSERFTHAVVAGDVIQPPAWGGSV
ncbi:MAG TPA: RES family NAD+ phosphorylase [Stenotrophomonas sp.]|jgi:hypothetical protein